MSVAVMLFTSDLRLHDQPALRAALRGADEVVPLFVLDRGIRRAGFDAPTAALSSPTVWRHWTPGCASAAAGWWSVQATSSSRSAGWSPRAAASGRTTSGTTICRPMPPPGSRRICTSARSPPPKSSSGRARKGGPGADAFVRQLAWRDFHHQVLAARPGAAHADYRARGDHWRRDEKEIAAWKAGRTGCPIVDAAMRQLLHEGWMHNRGRLLAASYLTKTLYVDWRIGARHFLDLLVDGDIANNQLNWQWVAGTGTDTRPNRVLNPLAQAKRFDPHGDYVRRWVPELAQLAGPAVHQPWKLDGLDRARLDYPDPLVDQAEGRARFERRAGGVPGFLNLSSSARAAAAGGADGNSWPLPEGMAAWNRTEAPPDVFASRLRPSDPPGLSRQITGFPRRGGAPRQPLSPGRRPCGILTRRWARAATPVAHRPERPQTVPTRRPSDQERP